MPIRSSIPSPPLLVIGASRGGAHALEALLPGLPADTPLAVVLVLHRGRFADGSLAQHLQKFCALPVSEPEDKEPLAPGRVFLAPADYHLLIDDGHFALSTDAPINHARPAIDVLFESAARAVGARVTGIVLTGAGDDGARGLAAIAAGGGHALVQEPGTAECRAMPDAALIAVPTAQVLPLAHMAAWLAQPVAAPSTMEHP